MKSPFRFRSTEVFTLGKIGEVDDIARAVSFFLNPDNDWVTGQVLRVEGGFSLKAKVRG